MNAISSVLDVARAHRSAPPSAALAVYATVCVAVIATVMGSRDVTA